jgi:hypothetical protein
MKEIIKKLQEQGTKFTVKGITTYKKEDKLFQIHTHESMSGSTLVSVREFPNTWVGIGMNVDKFGPTCMWLYDYDMFNKEIRYKVKYKDITFIEE